MAVPFLVDNASKAVSELGKIKSGQWKDMKGAMTATKEAGAGGFMKGLMDMIMNLKIFDMILKPLSALLKVFLNSVMQPLLPIFQMLGQAIMKFMPFIKQLGEQLGQVLARILEKIIPIIVRLMDEMGPPLFEILILLGDLLIELLPLLEIGLDLINILFDLDKEFGLMKYLMIGIHIAAKALGIAIKFVSGWVKTVIGLFYGGSPGLIPGFEAIADIVKIVIDIIYKQFLKVIDLVIVIIKEVTKIIEIISNFIRNTLLAILNFLMESLDTLVGIIDTLVSGSITILQTILTSLDNIISKLADSINSLVQSITDGLIAILNTLKGIIDTVVGALTGFMTLIRDTILGVMAGFNTALTTFKDTLIVIKGILDTITFQGGGSGGGNGGDDGDGWDDILGPIIHLQSGGTVKHNPGGTVVMAGESEDEFIIPKSKMGGGTNITINLQNAVIAGDEGIEQLSRKIKTKIWEVLT